MPAVNRIALLVTLGTLVSWSAACDREPGICEGAELRLVQTADEEAEAMQRFRDECRPLSMRAYDAAGEPVPFSDADWIDRVRRIDLSGSGHRLFEHPVIAGKNVALLMGE